MSFSDSAPGVGTLPLLGIWMHDPVDPEGSIRNYLYGASSRSRDVDTLGVANYYSGRTSPLVDYGEFEAESVACSVQIPHGPTWADDVAGIRALVSAKIPLFYRDNRGRVVPGTLSGYREQDQGWGTAVSFTITRADAPAPLTVVVG